MIKDTVNLGQLSFKEEAAGKVRVFAMVDIWTQSILKPLHDLLFRLFKSFPNDSTHNQDAGFLRAAEKTTAQGHAWSYDLSAATDRLPIDLQISVLNSLFPSQATEDNITATSFGQSWANLLVKRGYNVPENRTYGVKHHTVHYAVGQPMGAYSSWAMLNLTHHLICQYINISILKRTFVWHENYEVLGDDIVIFDPKLAFHYRMVMENQLGVACNVSKSLLAPDRPVFEFAKRVSIGMDEVSGFS
jgi:hypothetical protein